MLDKDEYISHIKDEEKIIKMKQILDKIELVLKHHSVEYSDFYDPYEVELSISILNRFQEIDYIISGGYKDAERCIIIIFPEYMYKEDIDYKVKYLEILGDFRDLKHPDFLGSVLSLGIAREKIGDILIENDRAILIAKSEISDFIYYNLEKIRNINVRINYKSDVDINVEPEFEELRVFLNSLRLDSVISGAYNLSRKDSANVILSDKVRVNWRDINKVSYELNIGDLISTRGFGRLKIYDVVGTSKKNKLIVILRKLI